MKENNVFYAYEDGIQYIVKPEEKIIVGKYTGFNKYLFKSLSKKFSPDDCYVYLSAFANKKCHYRPDEIVAVAKCDPRDEFDIEYGKKIVKSKIDYKKHIRAAKTIDDLTNILDKISSGLAKECINHIEKTDAINDDYLDYFMKRKK